MDEEKTKVQARVFIEIVGAPKEHIAKTMDMLTLKIKEDENIKLIGVETAEPVEKDKMWSIFTESEIEVEDIPTLIGFCFDYMPSSVEILSPEKFSFKSRDFGQLLNDMQTRLHQIDMVLKGLNAENKLLKRNGSMLLNNIVFQLLREGEKNIDEISSGTGIATEQLKQFLDVLVKNRKIYVKGDNYSLA